MNHAFPARRIRHGSNPGTSRLIAWVLSSFICFAFSVSAQEKMVFATVIMRHGDRTPFDNIAGENPGSWPEGFGKLTELGKKQVYTNGLVMRQLYCPGLFDSNNAASSVRVFSTDWDRTRLSAQGFLTGLVGLAAPSIPIETNVSIDITAGISATNAITAESLLNPHNDPDYFKRLASQYVFSKPEWIATNRALKPQMNRWSRAMGRRIPDIDYLVALASALYACQVHQHPPPRGLSPDDVEAIISAGHWARVYQFSGEAGRITGRPLLRKVAQYMKNARDEELSQKKARLKFILFSAHDTTLLSVMSALGAPLTGDHEPPYASYLHFALFETDPANFNVRVTYHDDQDRVVPNPANGGASWSLDQLLKWAGQ